VKRRGQIEEMRAAVRGDFERAGIPLQPRPLAQMIENDEEPPAPVEEELPPLQMRALRTMLSSLFRRL
jgi:hypothetical protein